MLSPHSPQNELADPSHAVFTSNSPTERRVHPSGILSKKSPRKCGAQKIDASKAVGKGTTGEEKNNTAEPSKQGGKGNTSGKLSRKSPHELLRQFCLRNIIMNVLLARGCQRNLLSWKLWMVSTNMLQTMLFLGMLVKCRKRVRMLFLGLLVKSRKQVLFMRLWKVNTNMRTPVKHRKRVLLMNLWKIKHYY